MSESVKVVTLRALLATSNPPMLIDVRRLPAFTQNPKLIPNAVRRLPEEVDSWATELQPKREVIVYCVYGHQVSQGVVSRLIQLGINARFLEGGIEQWKTEGGETVAAGT
jgi:thiosulfate sulfurtransferase